MVAVQSVPSTRSARPKARRLSARSRHSSTGCSHAPRPGRVADGSTTSSEFWATILRREDRGARERHPTHVLTDSILLLPAARAERTDDGLSRLCHPAGPPDGGLVTVPRSADTFPWGGTMKRLDRDARPAGRRTLRLVVACGLGAAALTAAQTAQPTVAPASAASAAWSQFGNGPSHSGVNAAETQITPSTVASLTPLFTATLPGVSDGPPVEQPGVATAGGTRDLLFTTTKDGWITATDATTGAESVEAPERPGLLHDQQRRNALLHHVVAGDRPERSLRLQLRAGREGAASTPSGRVPRSPAEAAEIATSSPTTESFAGAHNPRFRRAAPPVRLERWIPRRPRRLPGPRHDDRPGNGIAAGLQHAVQRSDRPYRSQWMPGQPVQVSGTAERHIRPGHPAHPVLHGQRTFDGSRNWGDSVLAINPGRQRRRTGPVDELHPDELRQPRPG